MEAQTLNLTSLLPWIIVVLVVVIVLAIIWWLLNRAPLPPALYFARGISHAAATLYNPRGSGATFTRGDLTPMGGGPNPAYTIELRNPESKENAPFKLNVSGLDPDQLVDYLNNLRVHVSTRRPINSTAVLGVVNLLIRILGLFLKGSPSGPLTHVPADVPIARRVTGAGELPADVISKAIADSCAIIDDALAKGLLLNQEQAAAMKEQIRKSSDVVITDASADRSLIRTEIDVPPGDGQSVFIVYYSFDPPVNAQRYKCYWPINAVNAWSQVYATSNRVLLTQWKYDTKANPAFTSISATGVATGYSNEIVDGSSNPKTVFGANVMGLADGSNYVMYGNFATRLIR